MEDILYAELLHFHSVSEGKYPERITSQEYKKNNCEKANFRQFARPFHQVEGVLMYGCCEVLVKSRLAAILHAYHDNPTTGAHFGRDKTYRMIKQRYYWRSMKKQFANYIKSCKMLLF